MSRTAYQHGKGLEGPWCHGQAHAGQQKHHRHIGHHIQAERDPLGGLLVHAHLLQGPAHQGAQAGDRPARRFAVDCHIDFIGQLDGRLQQQVGRGQPGDQRDAAGNRGGGNGRHDGGHGGHHLRRLGHDVQYFRPPTFAGCGFSFLFGLLDLLVALGLVGFVGFSVGLDLLGFGGVKHVQGLVVESDLGLNQGLDVHIGVVQQRLDGRIIGEQASHLGAGQFGPKVQVGRSRRRHCRRGWRDRRGLSSRRAAIHP